MQYSKFVGLAGMSYEDAYLIPQYSEISSRFDGSLKTNIKLSNLDIAIPIISANMDTITGAEMAIAMHKAGAIGALHRFWDIQTNVDEYKKVREAGCECLVSIGVNRDSAERLQALYEAGARYVIIDIAHGHSKLMKEMMQRVPNDVYLIAGNVATQEAVRDLISWGANAIKIGIGPGAVCLTKNVTGVTVPQLGAIAECASVANEGILLIADGGIREYGDIAKAIGAGAQMVMIGGLFAGCSETPGDYVQGKKIYRGMASDGAMRKIRTEDNLPTPEGTSVLIDAKGSAGEIVNAMAGGLRSAMSYSNALTIEQMNYRAKFGIKRSGMIR